MSTFNKDFRVKHGLIVEANTHLNGNLQVDGTINGLNVNSQAVHTQAAFDKANSANILAQAAFDQANTGGGGGGSNLVITNNTFTANGLTNSYTLSVTPLGENYTIINFDGITQQKSQYSVSGSTVTFTETPNNGTLIEVTTFTGGGGGSGTDQYARDTANSAGIYANTGITLAQAAFNQANTGGGSLPSNIVANSITSNTYVSIPYAIMTTGLAYANTAGSNTKVDNFSTTIFRGAKYNIQITSDSGYQISELSLLQYDTDVIISEYGVVCSNTTLSSLGTFYANVSNNIVNLNFNGVAANNVLVVYKIGIVNTGAAGTTLPEDLMTGSGTIDLSAGSGIIDLN